MASKTSFTTETAAGVAIVGGCLFAVDLAKSEAIGSTTQMITLAVAAALAGVILMRAPIIGFILATVVLVHVIKARNGKANAVKRFSPSEANKAANLSAYNHNHSQVTLEEEQVHNIIPFATGAAQNVSYHPVLGPQHLASAL